MCRKRTDKEEVARVRNNFLKKKLGLTNSDAELDKVSANDPNRTFDRTRMAPGAAKVGKFRNSQMAATIWQTVASPAI